MGRFLINVIQIDDWEYPSTNLGVTSHYLNLRDPAILYVPGGHVTGIIALEADSLLNVFFLISWMANL